MEEYFDILDEQGNITGEERLRSEAHTLGLWHRTVHIYFYRLNDGIVELLVHLRSKTKDLNPNKWDTRFGGHIKAGESIEEALKNELKEETGLSISSSQVSVGPIHKRDKFPNREFTNVYFYNFTGETSELVFNDGEVQEVKWISLDDALKSIEENSDQWSSRPTGFKEIKELLTKLVA